MSCCSGHGFKYAPALGEIALDWVEERENGFLRGFGTTSTRAPAVVGLR
jgi:glycine/D-amino acid oxidase-like deaminating enzyme